MTRTLAKWMVGLFLLTAAPAVSASDLFLEPESDGYRSHRARSSDRTSFYMGLSFAEGAYFRYRCDPDCDAIAVAPADFELFLGYKVARHFALDLAAVWAVDFDSYGNRITNMAGVRPGIKILFPGTYRRTFYLRAALPVLVGLSGENDDVLVGFLLGFGLEWRFGQAGFFAEVDFAPYFVEVADSYYVFPAQGRLGLALHF